MGMGMGRSKGGEAQTARQSLFALIRQGSSDTTLIFNHLERIVSLQRENQKSAILRILAMRDSLSGSEREAFLKKLDDRFCAQPGQRGMGRGRHGEN